MKANCPCAQIGEHPDALEIWYCTVIAPGPLHEQPGARAENRANHVLAATPVRDAFAAALT